MSETRLPQDRLARIWSESAQPSEMLATLRAAFDAEWLERNARALRLFAVWCARQRASHQGSSLLELAEWYAQGDFTPREVEPMRAANVSLANAASTKGLANPSTRACSAGFLAAFHALGADAFDAAVQAQRVVERYAATNESDANTLRREQAAMLRELLGNPYAELEPRTPRPAALSAGDDMMPSQFAWIDTGRWNAPAADMVRQLVAHREALLALDPWTPVPQASCTFAFGEAERPLPIGALITLWDNWPAAAGSCPRCGGAARAHSFGGTARRGGVLGVCVVCERELMRPVGGVDAIADLVRPVLDGTPFTLTRVSSVTEPVRGDAYALSSQLAQVAIDRMTRELR